MTKEIYEILNDADDVMESVGYDPFGMNVVLEATLAPSVNINSLTAKDLQDPAKLDALTNQLNNVDSADKVVSALVKVNKILTAGSVATTAIGMGGGDTLAANVVKSKGIRWTVLNVILGIVARKVKKSISEKKIDELKRVDSLLTTSIADMKKAQVKASKDDKEKLQASIDKAETVKSYIASTLEKQSTTGTDQS